MNEPKFLDEVRHLVEPIAGAEPTGASLRYDVVYQRIAEACREDDASLPQGAWESQLKRADWRLVEQLCTEVLKQRSKDLQVAAWLTQAWLHLRGLTGVAQGLRLIESLCTTYWDAIHPQIENEDLEERGAPFAWINANVSLALKLVVPMTRTQADDGRAWTLADWEESLRLENLGRKDSKVLQAAERQNKPTRAKFLVSATLTPVSYYAGLLEQLDDAASATTDLERVLQERLGEASSGLLHVREALDTMRQVVREFIGQRPLAPELPQQEKAMPDDIHVRDDPQALIQSREDAYRRLAEAAEYLLRTEPHSPTPYLIKRAVAWGSMPLTELLQELVQSEGDLQQLYGLLGMRSDQ